MRQPFQIFARDAKSDRAAQYLFTDRHLAFDSEFASVLDVDLADVDLRIIRIDLGRTLLQLEMRD